MSIQSKTHSKTHSENPSEIFSYVDFYNYKIRTAVIDDITYYHASDFLNQYNKENGKNITMKDWLKREKVKEYFCFLQENHEALIGASRKQDNHELEISNSRKQGGKLNIPPHIIYKQFSREIQGYWTSGEVLHSILMYYDIPLAHKLYTFLENLRQQDNEVFTDIIMNQKDQISALKKMLNRTVPDTSNDQWIFTVYPENNVKDKNDTHIYIRLSYNHKGKGRISKTAFKDCIYHLINIPNGYSFKRRAYDIMKSELKDFHPEIIGHHYSLLKLDCKTYYSNSDSIRKCIQKALVNIRKQLEWRQDLN